MNKYGSTNKITKIPINQVGNRSPNNIKENTKYYDTKGLQPGPNPGSSESDLVSGKMKEVIIVGYNSIIITITYNTCFLIVIPYNYTNNRYL